MAWDRVIELAIGPDPTAGVGVLVSDLDVSFRVHRSTIFSDNSAEFTIYNAAPNTRKEILVEGSSLVLRAGYRDSGVGTIFVGSVTKAISGRAGADWVTEIKASAVRGAGRPLDSTMISLSYAPETTVAVMLADVAAALGLVLTGRENAQIPMTNGWAFAGRARDALTWASNALKTRGVGLYVDNAEIVIYMAGQPSTKFTAAYLTYETGLLSARDITEDPDTGFVARARAAGAIVSGEQGQPVTPQAVRRAEVRIAALRLPPTMPRRVAFKAMLIPKLQPNSVLQIKTPEISGVYIADTLDFQGSNFENDFIVEGEASAPTGAQ